MAMTRKDYELIAKVILNRVDGHFSRLNLAEAFAGALAANNWRFDRQKFIDAATGNREDGMAEYADPYVNPTTGKTTVQKRQLHVGNNGPAVQPPAIVD